MSIIILALYFIMCAVIMFDVTRFIIPNWLVGLLLLLYPIALFFVPVMPDLKMALAGFGITFMLGYLIFTLRLMGGGDAKLIMVCGLWVGLLKLIYFIIYFSVLGGVLSIALILLRKFIDMFVSIPSEKLPRILRKAESVPYGVAIAIAFMLLMNFGGIPMLGVIPAGN